MRLLTILLIHVQESGIVSEVIFVVIGLSSFLQHSTRLGQTQVKGQTIKAYTPEKNTVEVTSKHLHRIAGADLTKQLPLALRTSPRNGEMRTQ